MKNTRNRILGTMLVACLTLVACEKKETPKAIFGPGEWNLNNGTIVTEAEAARLAGLTATGAELSKLAGVTAGTVTASKALVVDANKDLSALRNLTLTNLDAGASGTAGSLDVFPATASKGKTAFTATDNAGNTTTTITTAAQAGARTYTIPDAGASANVLLTTGTATATSATTTEIDKLAGVAAGTVTASKALVVGADKNLDTLAIADSGLKLGAGAGTAVTATAAELNKTAGVTGGTTTASKALVVDANKSLDTLSLVELKLGASGSGVAVTSTAAELNAVAGAPVDCTIAVGAEAGNAIECTVQLKDADNTNVALARGVTWWLSSNASGDAVTATAPNGGTAFSGGATVAAEAVTDKFGTVISSASGAFSVILTDSGTPTFYLAILLPNGKLIVSGAITFA